MTQRRRCTSPCTTAPRAGGESDDRNIAVRWARVLRDSPSTRDALADRLWRAEYAATATGRDDAASEGAALLSLLLAPFSARGLLIGRDLIGWRIHAPHSVDAAVLWSRIRGVWVVRCGDWSEEVQSSCGE